MIFGDFHIDSRIHTYAVPTAQENGEDSNFLPIFCP